MIVRTASDCHLNHACSAGAVNFIRDFSGGEDIASTCCVLAGDISEAKDIVEWLAMFSETAKYRVFFCLGNHDFWGGSFKSVRKDVAALAARSNNLIYLGSSARPHKLAGDIYIVGSDGWYDCRYADPLTSNVRLNDFVYVQDLAGLSIRNIVDKCKSMADEQTSLIHSQTIRAIEEGAKVIVVVTHAPPFAESSTNRGKQSDGHWMPWMSNQSLGDMLLGIAAKHRDVMFHVVAGHTHGAYSGSIRANVCVTVNEAHYGAPAAGAVLQFSER